MADRIVRGLPGVRADRSAQPRLVCLAGAMFMPGGKIIRGAVSRDPLNTGDLDVLRAGLVMGKITANNKYAPSILGVTLAAYDASASVNTTLTVSAATATEIVRRIGTTGTFHITGPPTAGGTVAPWTDVAYSAVNTTTGVITITALAADYVIGSLVQPDDGSEVPLCLVGNGYGIKVTDEDASNIDVQFPMPLVGGHLDASQIVNYPSDASLKAWLKYANLSDVAYGLNAVGQFTFDDDF